MHMRFIFLSSLLGSGVSLSTVLRNKSHNTVTFAASDSKDNECYTVQADDGHENAHDRRRFVSSAFTTLLGSATILAASSNIPVYAVDTPDGMDVNGFLKTGMVQMPMGVSGQAGKSKPETGVIFREGSELLRDSRAGAVSTEILLRDSSTSLTSILTSFESPWPLATGTVFDVECRDSKTGDGVFLSVSSPISKTGGNTIADLPNSFFLDELFKPTGRFSFYGSPTDVKVRKSTVVDSYRFLELSFSTLSQSTNAEIPRNAIVSATIPPDTNQAVMLTASASAIRWKKGSGDVVRKTVESFRAVPAPKTSMNVRRKERRGELV